MILEIILGILAFIGAAFQIVALMYIIDNVRQIKKMLERKEK
jgi:hypothetical protein